MNIAFFTIKTVNPFIGGVERVTFNLAQYFESQNINVYYFHLCGQEDNKHFILPQGSDNKIKSVYIRSKLNQNNIQIIIDQYGVEYISHKYLKKDVVIIRCWHLNIIEKHITRCLLETFFYTNIKTSILNFLFWLNTPIRKYKRNKFIQHTICDTDAFILLSKYFVEYLYSKNITSKKILAINNAIPIIGKRLYQKENLVIYCGRIVHNPKNVLFLVYLWKRIYSKYPDWKMMLVGDGIDKRIIQNLIVKHKLERIQITGFTNPMQYYEKAKILLLPSYTEGFGMVLLEAMQNECIPIVFDSSMGFKDIIDNNKNGFIINALNKEKYIEKCKFLMDNEDIRQKMATQCYLKVANSFNMEKIGTEWIDLFQRLINTNI